MIVCRLPIVRLAKGLQEDRLPFPDNSFDLILSHHALNAGLSVTNFPSYIDNIGCRFTPCRLLPVPVAGKLSSTEPRFIVPRLARLLKRGGIASLMLIPFHAYFAFPGNC